MSRTSHPIEQEELMAYLDGELAPDRAAMAAAHLEKCRECQSLAGDLESVSRKMMAWQVESPDDLRMSQAIGKALEEREHTKTRPPARGRLGWRDLLGVPRLPRWVWAGGVTVVVLVALVFVSHLMFSPLAHHGFLDSRQASAPISAPLAPNPGLTSGEVVAGRGTLGKLEEEQTGRFSESRSGDSVSVNSYDGALAPSQAPASPAKNHSTTPVGPMVIRTATLTLITKDFDKARAAMEETLRRHGGYIGQLTVSAPGESGRTLTATLRVPAGQLDAALAELKRLGRVASEAQGGEEVTQQYVDLVARLENAKNSEHRLTEILRDRTGKLSDVLEVEQAIENVRGEIEQMEAQRKNLAKQVDFATLSTTLTEEYEDQLHAVPVSTFTRIRNAAVDGYETLTETIVNVVLFLFSYGPVLLLWGVVLFFPLRAVWRRLRKKMAAVN